MVIDDAELIAGNWIVEGPNRISVAKIAGGSSVAWIRVRLTTDSSDRTVCLFDHDGGGCDTTDVCSGGFTAGVIDAEIAIDDPLSEPIEVPRLPIVGAQLPGLVDLTGMYDGAGRICLDDGDHQECTAFARSGEEDLAVNGAACGPPVAHAGVDSVLECESPAGRAVVLDGSGSSDPNSTPGSWDDIVSFEWIEQLGEPGERLIATGRTPAVTLPLGEHRITLRVTDSFGSVDTDDLSIRIVDTRPPQLQLQLSTDTLWPPNHMMVRIQAAVGAEDACGGSQIALLSVSSSEPDEGIGDGDMANDIQGAELGLAWRTSDSDCARSAVASDQDGNTQSSTRRRTAPAMSGAPWPLSSCRTMSRSSTARTSR